MRQTLQALTRDDSQVIKGIAVLLMILHHVLIPEFYVKPWSQLSNVVFVHLMSCAKLCVGIFAFITAYGYAFAKQKDLNYSLRHIVRLLKTYWPICILTVILSALWFRQFDLNVVILNLFGLSKEYNCANHYVLFYFFAMLILPFVAKLIDSYRATAVVAIILICALICFLLNFIMGHWVAHLYYCLFYSPVLAVGYYFGKYDWAKVKHDFSSLELLVVLAFGLLLSAMFHNIMGFCIYTVATPMVVFPIVALFKRIQVPHLYGFLKRIGQVSVYMWFIHAIFFSSKTRSIFQEQWYWPDNIVVVMLSVTLISYLVSVLIMTAKRRLGV